MTMMTAGNNLQNQNHTAHDTALTKLFVGGLAWETPKEAMRDHFLQYGDILEAVIISDKLTGRSKGYGFVTFKDPEAAKKACEDPAPIINGRRANCNLAALGARRPSRPSSSATSPTRTPNTNTNPSPQQGVNVGPRAAAAVSTPVPIQLQWYYPSGGAAAATPSPFHHHQAVPFYGYSPPTYISQLPSDMNYNHNKLGYMNGHYSSQPQHHQQVYHPAAAGLSGQATMVGVGPNTLLQPFYPFYHFHHQQAMGLPAQLYSPAPIPIMPKPASILPTNAGTAAVGQHS